MCWTNEYSQPAGLETHINRQLNIELLIQALLRTAGFVFTLLSPQLSIGDFQSKGQIFL